MRYLDYIYLCNMLAFFLLIHFSIILCQDNALSREVVTNDSTKKFQIPVGHLRRNDSTVMYEANVLRMCAEDLRTKGIIPKNVFFNITTLESCNRFVGVANAAHLHHIIDAAVYFGPGCNEGINYLYIIYSFFTFYRNVSNW